MVTTVREVINPNGKKQTTAFIPAFLEDNQIGLTRDPDYEARLMARDPVTAAALRFGKWSVFAGQMFRTWDQSLHVVVPFEIPLHWPRWTSGDWGISAPWCWLFWTKDPDTRRLFVYRCLYAVGLTDPLQAERIKEHMLPGEVFMFHFADPSMWAKNKTSEYIAKSTYDVYLEHGIMLTKANNDQRSKISKTHSSLAPIHDKGPAVQVFDTCPDLIRTMPAIMYDPKNSETILDGQEDHAWDAYAYGLTNWTPPQPPQPAEAQQQPQNPFMRRRRI
jgi:phage terminase large subunit